ncbi:MAG: DUF6391 domain-containing protein [Anaerolineae bacterium]
MTLLTLVARGLAQVMDNPALSAVRRNHALEHATIHLLAQRRPGVNLMGRATPDGFFIYGAVTGKEIKDAAEEARARLEGGEHWLAIHPRCGTNLVVAGTLSGLGALLALSGRGSRWQKLPRVLLATTAAVFAAQPVGLVAQERITTSPYMDSATIGDVQSHFSRGVRVHRVSVVPGNAET